MRNSFFGSTRTLLTLLILFVLCATDSEAIEETGLKERLLELTAGRQVRLAWFGGTTGSGEVQTGVACFDTEDGRSRLLVPGDPTRPSMVWIVRDGKAVLYQPVHGDPARSTADGPCFLVDWDGTGKHPLLERQYAYIGTVHKDRSTGTEWIYTVENPRSNGEPEGHIYRYQLEDPGVRETIWDKSIVRRTLGVSPDGRYVAFNVNDSTVVALNLEDGNWKKLGDGCEVGVLPDSRHLAYSCMGDHGTLRVFGITGGGSYRLRLNEMLPRSRERAVGYVRWSPDPRYLTVRAPGNHHVEFRERGTSDIYFVKLNESGTTIEEWLRITDNGVRNSFSDSWIEPPGSSQPEVAQISSEAPVKGTPWPATKEGLVFLYDSRFGESFACSEDGEPIIGFSVVPHGQAYYDRFGSMVLTTGHFEANGAADHVAASLANADGFTLEATLDPGKVSTSPSEAISLMDRDGHLAFGLGLSGPQLVWLTPDTSGETRNAELCTAPRRPFHLLLRHSGETAAVFIDSRKVQEKNVAFPRTATHEEYRLLFGRGADDGGWSGALRSVAIYDRALSDAEVGAQFEALERADRLHAESMKEVPRLHLLAKLVAQSHAPDAREAAPYQRALSVCQYQVDRVLEGSTEADTIYAAHWVLMDATPMSDATREIGKTYDLVLEPYEAHPEIEGDLLSETIEMDFDAELYYELDPIGI